MERPATECGLLRVVTGAISFPKNAQPARHLILSKFVAAARAELVGCSDSPEALSAIGGEMVVTLRTKMEIAQYVCAASRTPRNFRLAQEEVKYRADAGGHYEANNHPEPRAHAAAR